MCSNQLYKKQFISSNHFFLFNHQCWNSFQFLEGMVHIWFLKKDVWKKQQLSTFDVWMLRTCNFFKKIVSSFEHVNFVINEKYS
jgi:isoleucyl-tRNA synthetase